MAHFVGSGPIYFYNPLKQVQGGYFPDWRLSVPDDSTNRNRHISGNCLFQ